MCDISMVSWDKKEVASIIIGETNQRNVLISCIATHIGECSGYDLSICTWNSYWWIDMRCVDFRNDELNTNIKNGIQK